MAETIIYCDIFEEYLSKVEDVVATTKSFIQDNTTDIALTHCERFDFLVKTELLKIRDKVKEYENAGFIQRLFMGNIYKGDTLPAFVAQTLYRVVMTADEYDYLKASELCESITKIAHKYHYTKKDYKVTITEVNNKYRVSSVVDGVQYPSTDITNKATYVGCLLELAKDMFSDVNNTMVKDFYEHYYDEEVNRIFKKGAPSQYVEYRTGCCLRDLFSPDKAFHTVGSIQYSNYNLEEYKRAAAINEECIENSNKLQGKQSVDQKADEFYRDTLVTSMGLGMYGTANTRKG